MGQWKQRPPIAYATLAIGFALKPTFAQHTAPAQVYQFDIPAESLSDSLCEFTLITDRQILFADRLSAHTTAPALHGAYSADDALAKLLQGSGLTFDLSSNSTAILRTRTGR